MKTKLFSSILAIGTLSSGVLFNITPAVAGGGSFKGNCSNGGFPRPHQPNNHHSNQPKPPENSHHGEIHFNKPKPPENSHHSEIHFNQPNYQKANLRIDLKPAQSAYKYDYSKGVGTQKGR
jgi:hypothetical protein